MSRARMIKPDFFQSRSLARVTIPARLTFIGLWVEADPLGRGIAHPAILRGRIWPLDAEVTDADIASHLVELARTGHVALYQVKGEGYYQVNNWMKHQSASYRTGEAKFPALEDGEIVDPAQLVVQVAQPIMQAAQLVVQEPGNVPSPGETTGVVQVAQSVVQVAQQVVHEVKSSEVKSNKTTASNTPRAKQDVPPERFDEFWSLYPKKDDKLAAIKAYRRALKLTTADVIIDAVRSAQFPTDRQYIKNPATWLNAGSWGNEPGQVHAKRSPSDTGWTPDAVDPFAGWSS